MYTFISAKTDGIAELFRYSKNPRFNNTDNVNYPITHSTGFSTTSTFQAMNNHNIYINTYMWTTNKKYWLLPAGFFEIKNKTKI